MAKKGGSDSDFLADIRANKVKAETGHVGMVMTKPPQGPSKSLSEVIIENSGSAVGVHVTPRTHIVGGILDPKIGYGDGVGRILESKISETATLPVSEIRPSEYQVRSIADPEYIESLMESIVESGVISPIVVRPLGDGYEIIAGHHRFEACRRLGQFEVPVSIKVMSDAEAAKALASDNLVRKELCDFERYKHAKMLIDRGFCKTRREAGTVLGVSPSTMTNLMTFDRFSEAAQKILEDNPGILGATQAKDLESEAIETPELMNEALLLVAEKKLQQTKVKTWIESKKAGQKLRLHKRSEVKISLPGLASLIKLTFTDSEAKIQAQGLNVDKLKELIEANIASLIER